VLLAGELEGLVEELQRLDAVALHGIDVATLAAGMAAIELAGHDVAEVLALGVGAGRGGEQAPVALVHLDDGIAEGIDLVNSAEPLQAKDSLGEVRADLHRVVPGIEGDLA